MSKLEKLLAELYPNGVEYKKLSDIATVARGVRVVREQLAETGEIPVYQNSIKPLGYHDKSNVKAYSASVIGAGAAGEIGFSDIDFWAADDCYYFICPDNLNNRYLYFVLMKNQPLILSRVRKASIPRLSRTVIEKLVIPVPPMEVQAEIVKILDNFTELTARNKQYEYYLKSLLYKDFPLVPLSYCCSSIADGDHQPPPKSNDGIPFITISDVKNNQICFDTDKFVSESYFNKVHDKRKAKIGDILYTIVGSFGIPVYIDYDRRFVFQRHIAILRPDNKKIGSKFLFFCMKSNRFYKQADMLATGAAQRTIGLSSLNKMLIPLPPIEEQERIVSILDRFDKLCNDISAGLPAEIEARKKQYEYYRDKLLSFEEVRT